MWSSVKLLHIRYNLFAGTEMLSFSVYEPIAIQILLQGTVPQFGGGGRVWYPVKLLHIRYNLFARNEMLSLSVYEPITKQILLGWARPPIWREAVELGGRVWCRVKAHHNGHNLSVETDTLSSFVQEPYAWQVMGLGDPTQNWGKRWS